jgi:hypothetical protein
MTRGCIKATARLLMVLAGAGSGAAMAQDLPPADGPELEEYCRNAPCRRNVVTQIRLADGRIQEESKPLHRPALVRGSLSIMLGEELVAVPDFQDEQFRGWRPPERREPSRNPVLTFKLNQESDASVAASISNSGPDPIKLRLYVRSPGASEGEYTSSCPVLSGGTVYEYWNRPVVEVIVVEAILLEDDALLCD